MPNIYRTVFAALIALMAASFAAAQSVSERVTGRVLYPEGPIWADSRLYVAEMGASRISAIEGTRRRTFWSERGCGPTALAPYRDGWLVLCHMRGQAVALDAARRVSARIGQDEAGGVFRDPNDAAADGAGGVYFSDPGEFSRDTIPEGALVHLDAAGVARRVAFGLWYPNGVWVDRARRQLYVSETFRRRVLRYSILEGGALGPMEVFAELDALAPAQTRYEDPFRESGPDGLEIGPDGDLYVAIYGEGRVLRIAPDGAYRGQIETETRFVTNVTFDPQGRLIAVGMFNIMAPPWPGEVRRWARLPAP